MVWFAVASLLCAVAPDVTILILARALQGVGAALLTPGSLAILEAVFRPDDRGKAIGAWSGFNGVGTAIGPFIGGYLVHVITFVVYAAIGGALFLLPIELQQVSGYTALEAGISLLPVTVITLLLSRRSGALASRIGPGCR